jgi:hypothetical protein
LPNLDFVAVKLTVDAKRDEVLEFRRTLQADLLLVRPANIELLLARPLHEVAVEHLGIVGVDGAVLGSRTDIFTGTNAGGETAAVFTAELPHAFTDLLLDGIEVY